MSRKFPVISKVFLFAAAAVYPALIFYFLVIRKTEVRQLSLFIIAFALLAFIAGTSRQRSSFGISKKKVKKNRVPCFGRLSSFSA